MTESADQLLEQWGQHADVVESYIRARNYRKFRLAYRKAEQCSRKIQFLMRHGHTKPFLEQKDRVKQLVERWDSIAENQIQPWMNETKGKIDKIKTKKKVSGKINKAYSYMSKKTGQTLKMKAR